MTDNRAPRSEETRNKTARRQPWRPPSALDAPPAPEGYVHRWVREWFAGQDDRKNISARLREGFELVRAEEYPDFAAPSVQDGKHAGVIGVGGLLLARFPIETNDQRRRYYAQQANDQMTSVDNDLMKEQHPSMAIHKPERRSRVQFGGRIDADADK